MDPLSLIAAAAIGAIIGQGNHQMDGFRDTGCDPAHQVAVTSERTGEVLYWNNATCPTPSGPSDAVAGPVAPAEPTEPENGNGENGYAEGNGGTKGNASANNGKGGNYAWTGHVDNGQGNGRGRR